MSNIDHLDEQLLELLAADARQNSKRLATQLAVSAATARRRLKKLLQSGAVHIVGVADPYKIGLPVIAVTALKVERDKVEEVLKALSRRPRCRWLSTTTGRFDILAIEWFSSTDSLSYFVQKDLAKIAGIKDTETFICLHVHKGFAQHT